MTPPRISVVVATRGRPAQLARLREALARQTFSDHELIVIDDGAPAPRGQSVARNQGWRAAKAELVAFTDDDCVPAAWWLEELATTSEAHPGAIVQGRTLPDPQTKLTPRTRSVTVTGLGPQFQTCNIAYPRELLERLGGFDETIPLPVVGEDTDLAYRALQLGAEIVFATQALVHHDVVRTSPREATRWGGTARLYKRHPAARTMLYGRLFWNVWHYLLVRSLLAWALPPRARRTLHRKHLRALRNRAKALEAGPTAIPYLLAYDAIETVAAVRGALRDRTPLL